MRKAQRELDVVIDNIFNVDRDEKAKYRMDVIKPKRDCVETLQKALATYHEACPDRRCE